MRIPPPHPLVFATLISLIMWAPIIFAARWLVLNLAPE